MGHGRMTPRSRQTYDLKKLQMPVAEKNLFARSSARRSNCLLLRSASPKSLMHPPFAPGMCVRMVEALKTNNPRLPQRERDG